MSAAAAPLLCAAGVRQLTRSASGVIAKAARGFQVFRVDGYSWTKKLPGGARVTSDRFPVGGHHWYIDYYPNGDDISKDYSDSISLYLRLHGAGYKSDRVRAEYKFSLLDVAGNAAYELPATESTFTYAGPQDHQTYQFPEGSACGQRDFITREELERRREALLKDDCLAVRCDVGVVQLDAVSVAPKDSITNRHDDSDDDDSDCEGSGEISRRRRRQRRWMDDSEFIRRCLAKNRRA